jgi:hypothetical protein
MVPARADAISPANAGYHRLRLWLAESQSGNAARALDEEKGGKAGGLCDGRRDVPVKLCAVRARRGDVTWRAWKSRRAAPHP